MGDIVNIIKKSDVMMNIFRRLSFNEAISAGTSQNRNEYDILCEENIITCINPKEYCDADRKYKLTPKGLKIRDELFEYKFIESIIYSIDKSKPKQEILETLTGKAKTVSEICEDTGLNKSTVNSGINYLLENEVITCLNHNDKINKRYGLTSNCISVYGYFFEFDDIYDILDEDYFYGCDLLEETVMSVGGIELIVPDKYSFLEEGWSLAFKSCVGGITLINEFRNPVYIFVFPGSNKKSNLNYIFDDDGNIILSKEYDEYNSFIHVFDWVSRFIENDEEYLVLKLKNKFIVFISPEDSFIDEIKIKV